MRKAASSILPELSHYKTNLDSFKGYRGFFMRKKKFYQLQYINILLQTLFIERFLNLNMCTTWWID